MPTYTSPVAVSDLQEYLKDTSTDAGLLAFFQTLLNTSTEYVYTWLDRDFTPSAAKSDVFYGDDSNEHRLHSAADHIVSWQYRDTEGNVTVPSPSLIVLFESGLKATLPTMRFMCGYEYEISYLQPSTLTCPESVKEVILEHAAVLFRESNQGLGTLGEETTSSRDPSYTDRIKYIDLSPRHEEILRTYKRYPV